MRAKTYRNYLAFAVQLCDDVYHDCFKHGMDLALSGEMRNVAEVLDPGETLAMPYDILTTMKDPFVLQLHTVGDACGTISDTLANINALTDGDIDEAIADVDEMEVKKGFSTEIVPTRKQVLNVLFKHGLLTAVCMTYTLQQLALLQGHKLKNRRHNYYFNNKDVFINSHDANIVAFARATELLTELVMGMINLPGFTNKPKVPKGAKYYPVWDWLGRDAANE